MIGNSQPARDERLTERVVTDPQVSIQMNRRLRKALMYNLSVGGCMIHCDRAIPFMGDRVDLLLEDLKPIGGTIAWQVEHFCGIRFDDFVDPAIVHSLGFKEPEYDFEDALPRDRFGRILPVLSGRLPF